MRLIAIKSVLTASGWVLFLASLLAGQQSSPGSDFEQGVSEFRSGHYSQAVTLLERAEARAPGLYGREERATRAQLGGWHREGVLCGNFRLRK